MKQMKNWTDVGIEQFNIIINKKYSGFTKSCIFFK